MDWFYYNFIILTKEFKIPYKNLDKSLLFLRNQVFYPKIWKLWRAPTTLHFNIFLLKLPTHFLLTNVYKRVCRDFLFSLDLAIFGKIKKDLVSTHLFFILLLITQYKAKLMYYWIWWDISDQILIIFSHVNDPFESKYQLLIKGK